MVLIQVLAFLFQMDDRNKKIKWIFVDGPLKEIYGCWHVEESFEISSKIFPQ